MDGAVPAVAGHQERGEGGAVVTVLRIGPHRQMVRTGRWSAVTGIRSCHGPLQAPLLRAVADITVDRPAINGGNRVLGRGRPAEDP